MIGLDLKIIDREVLVRLEGLPDRLRPILEAKFEVLIQALREKVVKNLSGEVLETKSGALLRSLTSGVEMLGPSTMVGYVDIEPENESVKAYALAHEYGGKGYYTIVPVDKSILRFVGKSGEIVFAGMVNHPPAAERSYLRSALEAEEPVIVAGLEEAIEEALFSE